MWKRGRHESQLYDQRNSDPLLTIYSLPTVAPGRVDHLENKSALRRVHALLLEVGARAPSRQPVLLNTSFNRKGKPIVNRADEALRLLYEQSELDYLVIDGWLFASPLEASDEEKHQRKKH
jgi:hypothetical protein